MAKRTLLGIFKRSKSDPQANPLKKGAAGTEYIDLRTDEEKQTPPHKESAPEDNSRFVADMTPEMLDHPVELRALRCAYQRLFVLLGREDSSDAITFNGEKYTVQNVKRGMRYLIVPSECLITLYQAGIDREVYEKARYALIALASQYEEYYADAFGKEEWYGSGYSKQLSDAQREIVAKEKTILHGILGQKVSESTNYKLTIRDILPLADLIRRNYEVEQQQQRPVIDFLATNPNSNTKP